MRRKVDDSGREEIAPFLLQVLHLLLTERSVTRTAGVLGQTQPAISAALRQLREITGDLLLIRVGTKMVPTEHGLRLLEPASKAMVELKKIRRQAGSFDPRETRRTFRLALPDSLCFSFVPEVIRQFGQQAPGAKLEIHDISPACDYEEALEKGGLDLVVGNWPSPPEQLRLSHLYADRFVCVMREGHPLLAQKLTVTDYLSWPQLICPSSCATQRGPFETLLARGRRGCANAVRIPHFSLAPEILLRTDLILTTASLFIDGYAQSLPLVAVPLPVGLGTIEYYQLWHERAHYSPEVRWLRTLVSGVAEAVLSPRAHPLRPVRSATNWPSGNLLEVATSMAA